MSKKRRVYMVEVLDKRTKQLVSVPLREWCIKKGYVYMTVICRILRANPELKSDGVYYFDEAHAIFSGLNRRPTKYKTFGTDHKLTAAQRTRSGE